eukprot:15667159-Heterocapsa_arctica.AAC.1
MKSTLEAWRNVPFGLIQGKNDARQTFAGDALCCWKAGSATFMCPECTGFTMAQLAEFYHDTNELFIDYRASGHNFVVFYVNTN